jgi:hypothetical protein
MIIVYHFGIHGNCSDNAAAAGGVESLAMKACTALLALAILVAPILPAQTQPNSRPVPQGFEVYIVPAVAEKLLIHKANIVCPHSDAAASFVATVVVGYSIDKNGNVLRPRVISGPAMLRKAVVDAVRNYKYKPYLLNGEAIEVYTTASVTVDSLRDCPAN